MSEEQPRFSIKSWIERIAKESDEIEALEALWELSAEEEKE